MEKRMHIVSSIDMAHACNWNTNKQNKWIEAIHVIKNMSIFELIFIRIIFTEILFQFGMVSKLLQSSNVDILKAIDKS